jgi:transcriptional regulator with PAS, ATPase and Fis domain
VLPLKTYLQRQELAHLNRAIQQCGGDKEQAALLLGISKATLYRRMGGEDKEA